MKRWEFTPLVSALIIVFTIVVFALFYRESLRCQRAGGHYVRGLIRMECIK